MKRMASVLAGCIMVGGLLAVGISAHALTRQQFEDKAIPLLDKRQAASQLLELCNEALKTDAKTDPDYAAFAQVVKSHAHILRKEYANAETEARKAIKSGYQSELGHSALMDVLFATGKYDEGREICMQGADKHPEREVQILAREDCQEMYIKKAFIRVEDLWHTFTIDPTTATKRYRGEQLTVRGRVQSADTSTTGARIVMNGAKDAKNSVFFEFSYTQPAEELSSEAATASDVSIENKKDDSKDDTSTTQKNTLKNSKNNNTAEEKPDSIKLKKSQSLVYTLDPKTGVASKSTETQKNTNSVESNNIAQSVEIKEKASVKNSADLNKDIDKEKNVDTHTNASRIAPEQDLRIVLPPVGSIVLISGTIRGIDNGRLVLTNCSLVGQ